MKKHIREYPKHTRKIDFQEIKLLQPLTSFLNFITPIISKSNVEVKSKTKCYIKLLIIIYLL